MTNKLSRLAILAIPPAPQIDKLYNWVDASITTVLFRNKYTGFLSIYKTFDEINTLIGTDDLAVDIILPSAGVTRSIAFRAVSAAAPVPAIGSNSFILSRNAIDQLNAAPTPIGWTGRSLRKIGLYLRVGLEGILPATQTTILWVDVYGGASGVFTSGVFISGGSGGDNLTPTKIPAG